MAQPQVPAQGNPYLPLIAIGAFIFTACIYGLWCIKHAQISFGVLIAYFHALKPFSFLPFVRDILAHVVGMASYPDQVRPADLAWTMNLISYFYAPPLIVIGACAGIYALRHPLLKARRVHDMESLLHAMSKNFPAVTPVLWRDLTEDDSLEWAPSQHPQEYVKRHQLVRARLLDVEATKKQLLADLGRKIKNLTELNPHERALFAVFGERIVNGRKASQSLLDDLNRSSGNRNSKPNYTLANEAFERLSKEKKLTDLVVFHPYARTYLMALLNEGRETGALPNSEFLWLKPNDRPLWYGLQGVGRKTPFVEGLACFCQWKAEQLAAKSNMVVVQPFLNPAIIGLQEYLEQIRMIDKESSE